MPSFPVYCIHLVVSVVALCTLAEKSDIASKHAAAHENTARVSIDAMVLVAVTQPFGRARPRRFHQIVDPLYQQGLEPSSDIETAVRACTGQLRRAAACYSMDGERSVKLPPEIRAPRNKPTGVLLLLGRPGTRTLKWLVQ